MSRNARRLVAAAAAVAAALAVGAAVQAFAPAGPRAWTVAYWTRVVVDRPIAAPSIANAVTATWSCDGGDLHGFTVTSTTDATGFAATAVNVRDRDGRLARAVPSVSVNLMDGDWHLVVVTAQQSGADVTLTVRVDQTEGRAVARAVRLADIEGDVHLGGGPGGDAERHAHIEYGRVASWGSAWA